MRKAPPHILVTTPESLYILLGSESGRRMLAPAKTVIVDEIHAVAPNKRGSHLALSLERLDALCGRQLQRIGLSATQRPIELVARFLVGAGPAGGPQPECTIIDTGHVRARDLALELPSSPLEAVMSGEVWEEVYDRIAELTLAHRTTLVFVNTRRMAERATRALSERLGADQVAAHHGSLSKERRLDAETRLKSGALKALVATASLELGIDIGDVDLVCQLGSPRSIAAFLQRVGRSGHAVGGTPKGRLFPLSRDELVECAALLDSVARGELDRLCRPGAPARRAGAADRRRGRGAGMERGRAVRAVPPVVSVPRPAARGFRRDRRDAGGRVQYAARPARRADPSRRGQRDAARPARRPDHGADLGRHDPGHGRLPGPARTGKPGGRHGQRGFRGREPGRRRVPARQRRLSHPPRRARHTAGRGRARASRPTSRSGSAKPPAAPTSCRRRCRACGARSRLACARPKTPTPPSPACGGGGTVRAVAMSGCDRRGTIRDGAPPLPSPHAGEGQGEVSTMRSNGSPPGPASARPRRGRWPNISPPAMPRSACCRRMTRSFSSGFSTKPAACSWSCIRLMAAG